MPIGDKCNNEPTDPPLGSIVEIPAGRGTVRFCGVTSFSPGKWIGIELDEPKGKNDGNVQGVKYFTCKMLCYDITA